MDNNQRIIIINKYVTRRTLEPCSRRRLQSKPWFFD